MNRLIRPLFVMALVLCNLANPAHADINIEIVGTNAQRFPIAVSGFEGEASLTQALTPIIRSDLDRSGLFKLIETGPAPLPSDPAQVNFPDWGKRGADSLLIGSVTDQGGQTAIRFRLFDVAQKRQLVGLEMRVKPGELRRAAHRVADVVYEALTGDKGVFSTRIAYVVKKGKTAHELQIADADGAGGQTILASRESIMSPAWSPDGSKLAYVSFEERKPIVYVQDLVTGSRRRAAAFKGSNSAPAWSPDGSKLAVVLTLNGLSQIYSVNVDGGSPVRLSKSHGIDTEPNYSPDGQSIVFTSDRGGSPQVYLMPASGGDAQRLTFEGSYNVSPRFSPDGKSITFIRREGGRFNVASLDLATRQTMILTTTELDESPSFAPNSRMILYATEQGGRGVLAAVSSDGRIKQRLSVQAGDAREPAWGPFTKQ
ncbi:Tol-Pal system beta propeller repeat protein TolB [Parachitinimonas caeni]|uniref:Tol-Pal system protein TolB n=1 Tax=Parachitinimonas caeni TaxID=3031301 RepID=A0ABT7DV44_9NEIS|nr:Tol-Pal system beta propeller repeat protein TolB [Parachitinimonas caeni]MDK2122517.1 Tol-Pal system beta propeller repeat protein TolB [Parachitinimonas caeni]